MNAYLDRILGLLGIASGDREGQQQASHREEQQPPLAQPPLEQPPLEPLLKCVDHMNENSITEKC